MELSEKIEIKLKENNISWGWGDSLKYFLPEVKKLEQENEQLKQLLEKLKACSNCTNIGIANCYKCKDKSDWNHE